MSFTWWLILQTVFIDFIDYTLYSIFAPEIAREGTSEGQAYMLQSDHSVHPQ